MLSTVEVHRRVYGATHLMTITAEVNLYRALAAQGKYVEVEALAHDVLDTKRRLLGAEHRHTMTFLGILIESLVKQEKTEEARRCKPPGLFA